MLVWIFFSLLTLPSGDSASNGRIGWGWRRKLTPRYTLIARGTKATDFYYTRKDERTGREKPIQELNRWFENWNHHHIAFSKNGRWAVWRDQDDLLIAVSLDGRMKRVAWGGGGAIYDPLVWLPDNRRFLLFGGQNEDSRSDQTWRSVAFQFDRTAPRRVKRIDIPKTLGEKIDRASTTEEYRRIAVKLAR